MPYRLIILLFILVAGFGSRAYAGSVAAGLVSYSWLSDSTYRVVFKLYNDCDSNAAPATVNLCVYNSCNNTNFNTTMHQVQSTIRNGLPNGAIVPLIGCTPRYQTRCDNPGSDVPGIREWWYADTVTLPERCSSWKFRVAISSRVKTQNITTGNMLAEATLNNQLSLQNSSPVTNEIPLQFVCVNQPYTYSLSATDTDGDSLDYILIQPQTVSNLNCGTSPANISLVNNVTPPHNLSTNPFQTNNTFSLGRATGQVSYTPGVYSSSSTGTFYGTYTIKIDEYRNGQLIGNTIVDNQVQVYKCFTIGPPGSGNTISILPDTIIGGTVSDTMYEHVIMGCYDSNLEYSFYVITTDTAGRLEVSDNSDTLMSGASITYAGQGTDTIKVQLNWTPGANDTGLYDLTFIITDTTCKPPGIIRTGHLIKQIDIPGGVRLGNDTAICAHEPIRLYTPDYPFGYRQGGNFGGVFTWRMLPGSTGTLSCTNCATAYGYPAPTASYEITSSANWCPHVFTDTINVSTLSTPVTYPSINISVAPGRNIWQYLMATFTAATANCSNAALQWTKNGRDIPGATAATYSTTELIDGDVVACRFICNDTCPNPRDTISNSITMNVAMSVGDIAGPGDDLHIYPNPAGDVLHVTMPDIIEDEVVSLQILDITGRAIRDARLTLKKTIININSLTPGVYLVKVITGNEKIYISKMVKQ